MNILVITRKNEGCSVLNYQKNLINTLNNFNIIIDEILLKRLRITKNIKEYDLIWDPGLGMRPIPRKFFKIKNRTVCTIHGLRAFSLPMKTYYNNKIDMLYESFIKYRVKKDWSKYRKKVSAVITVSKFGAKEVASSLNIAEKKIFPIYHGVNHDIFKIKVGLNRKYFLVVSNYQPIKNIDRIFNAYSKIRLINKPPLLAVLPGYKYLLKDKNIELYNRPYTHHELSEIYNNAICLVFPSLRESFGMPILEAMACGCPVITSNVSACPEVAGDAALLVNPYSVEEIREAMERIIVDKHLREELSEKGLERAKQFTWEKSAQKHLEVFRKVINDEI